MYYYVQNWSVINATYFVFLYVVASANKYRQYTRVITSLN